MNRNPRRRFHDDATAADTVAEPTLADVLALGTDTLAQILWERAFVDPDLCDRLRLTVAARTGSRHLGTAVASRIDDLAHDETLYAWSEASSLAARIDTLRQAIADGILKHDPRQAADLLGALVRTCNHIVEHIDESSDTVEDAYAAAIHDWGNAWAAVPGRVPEELAALVLKEIRTDEYAVKGDLITAFREALGPSGHAALQRLIEGELVAVPAKRSSYRSDSLRTELQQVKDALRDAHGFPGISGD